jgi:hypothetical protein
MGWSDQEQLIVVLEDGTALVYDIHGKLVRNFLLLDAITAVHLIECHFWGNGVVALSSDMQLYVVEVCMAIDILFSQYMTSLFRDWLVLRVKLAAESTLCVLDCDPRTLTHPWPSCHRCSRDRDSLR